MKKFYLCLVLCLSVLFTSCNEAKKYENKGYNATTMELIQMVENNSELKNLLTQAIEKGKAINPDTTTNPVQSLDDYYEFIDFSQKVMPWNVILCPVNLLSLDACTKHYATAILSIACLWKPWKTITSSLVLCNM